MNRARDKAPFLSATPAGLRAADIADVTREVTAAAERIRAIADDVRPDIGRFMGLRVVAAMLEHEVQHWGERVSRFDTSAAFVSSESGRA